MTNPDPAGAHDIRTADGGMICARCCRFLQRGYFSTRCEPERRTHMRGRSGPGRLLGPLCGAEWGPSDELAVGYDPVTCPDCRELIGGFPRLGEHDLRAWGHGALCARCGERGATPGAFGPCVPPVAVPPAERRDPVHAAAEPLRRGGPALCGEADPAWLATLLRGRSFYASSVGCPDCLEAARGLPAWEGGAHDLRADGGGGVICPDCGIAAASAEDAGGCAGSAPVEMLRFRNEGRGPFVGLPSGTLHAPAGGCAHAEADPGFWRAADAPARVRVTCLNCIRRAARRPRLPLAA